MSAVEPHAAAPPPVVGSTLSVLTGSAVALAGTLIVRVLMARSLSPEQLGLLLLAIGVASAVGGVASLGLNSGATRRLAELRAGGLEAEARDSARTAMWVAAAAGAAAFSLLVLGAPRLGHLGGRVAGDAAILTAALLAVAPVALALPPGLAALGICRGFGRVAGRVVLRDGGGGLLRAAAVGIASAASGSVVALGAGFAAGVVAAEALFIGYAVALGWPRRGARAGWDRELLRRSPPFAGLALLDQANQWTDLIVLGLLAAPHQVGLYGVARGLTRSLMLIQSSAAHGFLPAATSAGQAAEAERFAAVYVRTRLFVLGLLWFPLVVCLIAPASLLRILFGEVYLPAAAVLRLLSLGVLVEAVFGYKDLALIALGRERALVRLNAAAVALCVGALLALVPAAGALGAALALLAAQVFRSAVLIALLRRAGSIRVRTHDLPPPVRQALAVGATGALAATVLASPGWDSVVAAAAGLAGSIVLLRAAGVDVPRAWRRCGRRALP